MQETNASFLLLVQEHVTIFFKEHISAEYVFHDVTHTQQVVESTQEIGKGLNMSIDEMEILQIAAWFHDMGYSQGADGHEARSSDYAGHFLTQQHYEEGKIKQVQECILATKMPHNPKTILQKILCDADMSHLGKKSYWDRSDRLRQELLITRSMVMNENEWIDFELNFMLNQRYHTPVAQALYNKRKAKHIKQLRKQKLRFNPQEALTVDEIAGREIKVARQQEDLFRLLADEEAQEDIKPGRLGRGVETMFRTTYQTHINLSAMADHKANLMITITTICVSITFSTLIPKLAEKNHNLIIPTVIFTLTSLISMIFATLSTRPKITEGRVSKEMILQKKSNLLFFGNFYRMKLDDFQWGIGEMIKDNEFLYSTMTRDIYYLGVVLAKKYRYLSLCYNIFMYGTIVSALAFAIAFAF
ncbi:MAG: hypothetical protein RLZZ292_1432 [Bacteroidota bacterium]|jgi:predicted metal-dependent HD superfamily phosphohydrolase